MLFNHIYNYDYTVTHHHDKTLLKQSVCVCDVYDYGGKISPHLGTTDRTRKRQPRLGALYTRGKYSAKNVATTSRNVGYINLLNP